MTPVAMFQSQKPTPDERSCSTTSSAGKPPASGSPPAMLATVSKAAAFGEASESPSPRGGNLRSLGEQIRHPLGEAVRIRHFPAFGEDGLVVEHLRPLFEPRVLRVALEQRAQR